MSFKRIYFKYVLPWFVTFLLLIYFIPVCFAVSSIEANNALISVENEVEDAYLSIIEAENVGANIIPLLNKLNRAGDFLSEAYIMFRAKNYSGTISLVELCSNSVKDVANDASTMRDSANRLNSNRLFLTFTGYGVGLFSLFILGFYGWAFLKKAYSKQVLDLKPVVVE